MPLRTVKFRGSHPVFLPKLQALSLYPHLSGSYVHPAFPVQLRDSFLAVLSTASLRRLELAPDPQFENTQDLQQILINSRGLKELTLSQIRFTDLVSRPSERTPPPVVLESMEIIHMEKDAIQAVLNSFSVVDITQLRSISCDRYHASLVQANAHSLQQLTLIVDGPGSLFHDDPVALDQILPANTSLQSLNIRITHVYWMIVLFQRLGNLASLKALKRLLITTSRTSPSALFQEWAKVDP
ncbi:hypothetical protein DFH09DRAFT_1076193 [Mycena vulgaris]|nr:hypothetical protein DFH09DRAFT_1076193 [Mycena vulgaris]